MTGLSDEVTLHTLRHTFASNLIAQGCDVVTVQRALGHSTPSITLNVYSHLWPSAEGDSRIRGFRGRFCGLRADRNRKTPGQGLALPVVDELQVDVEVGGFQQALDLLEVVAGLRLHAQLVALDLRLDRLRSLVADHL